MYNVAVDDSDGSSSSHCFVSCLEIRPVNRFLHSGVCTWSNPVHRPQPFVGPYFITLSVVMYTALSSFCGRATTWLVGGVPGAGSGGGGGLSTQSSSDVISPGMGGSSGTAVVSLSPP